MPRQLPTGNLEGLANGPEMRKGLDDLVSHGLAEAGEADRLTWSPVAVHLLRGVGTRIRELREARGMTRKGLRNHVRIWRGDAFRPMALSTMERREEGKSLPPPEELVQMALAFAAPGAMDEVLGQLFQAPSLGELGVRLRLLDVAKLAVAEAGSTMVQQWRRPAAADGPSAGRRASPDEMSFRVMSQEIRDGVAKAFPGEPLPLIGGDEAPRWAEQATDGQIVWITDSIDGTINFEAGLPTWCVAVAAARWDAKAQALVPQCAAVYCPPTGELFSAIADVIAFCESRPARPVPRSAVRGTTEKSARTFTSPGTEERVCSPWGQPRPLVVSQETSLQASVLGTHLGTTRRDITDTFVDQLLGPLCKICRRILMFGSAQLALCYVAAGWLHAFVTPVMNHWDVLAGKIILDAAARGGEKTAKVADFARKPWDWKSQSVLAACTGALRLQIENLILALWPDAPRLESRAGEEAAAETGRRRTARRKENK